MRFTRKAGDHGIAQEDVLHALRVPWKEVPQQYDKELGYDRMLVIGPARDGSPLEIVVAPLDRPDRVLHADKLRPKFYKYLRE